MHFRPARVAAIGALLLVPLAAFAGVRAMHGGPCGSHDRPQTADEVRDRMGWVSDLALDRVDATDAQRTEIEGILDEAAPIAFAHHDAADGLREAAHEVLLADQVDRKALETIRQEALGLFDEGSQQLVRVVGDIAETLTPEQRRQLADEIERFHR